MINNNIKTSLKEVYKPKTKVPKKEVSKPKPKVKVPKKEGSKPKPKAKVPKKEGSKPKPKAKVPKKEVSKPNPKAKVPNKEVSKPKPKVKVRKKRSKKPHQVGGYNPNKSLFLNFLNHIEGKNDLNLDDIIETLDIEANQNQNKITIIITGHGGKCFLKKNTESPLTDLTTKTAGINFTTWTTIGDPDMIKMKATRDIPSSYPSYDSNYTNKQAVLENHFKIARNYINGENIFFRPESAMHKGYGLLDNISSIYYNRNRKVFNNYSELLERFLQQVLELSHVEYKWENVEQQQIRILNLMLYPDKINEYLTCINISYVDENNKIKLITITLFNLFRFIIYSIAIKKGKSPPPITNLDRKKGGLSRHLTGLIDRGLQIEHIFNYIKEILDSLNLNKEDKIIDLHLHSCLSNINQSQIDPYLKTPRPEPKTLPSFNRFTYNKALRKPRNGEINKEELFDKLMMEAVEDFAIDVFNFDSVSLAKEYVGINKSKKYSRDTPGRMGKKRKDFLKTKRTIGTKRSKIPLKRKISPINYVKKNRRTQRKNNRSTVIPFNTSREFQDDFDVFNYLNQKYYEPTTKRIAGLVATNPYYATK